MKTHRSSCAPIFTALALTAALIGPAARAAVIGGDRLMAKPILEALAKAYQQNRKPAEPLRVVCRDDWTVAESFGRGQSDLMLSVGPLAGGMRTVIAQHAPGGNFVTWREVEIGQARVIAIVHSTNSIRGLTFDQVRELLAIDRGEKTTWKDLGGQGGLVTCYGEDDESASRLILRQRVMSYTLREDPDRPGSRSSGYSLYRKNFALCADAQEVIDEISRDRNGIGFITFTGRLPRDVRVLPLAEKAGGAFVTPLLEPVVQADYPLSQPIVLHVHPSASATALDFVRWTVDSDGKDALRRMLAAPPAGSPASAPPASPPTVTTEKPE